MGQAAAFFPPRLRFKGADVTVNCSHFIKLFFCSKRSKTAGDRLLTQLAADPPPPTHFVILNRKCFQLSVRQDNPVMCCGLTNLTPGLANTCRNVAAASPSKTNGVWVTQRKPINSLANSSRPLAAVHSCFVFSTPRSCDGKPHCHKRTQVHGERV